MSLTISSRDGLRLEATLAEASDPLGGVVLCHPHPRMGGTMNAPLLVALEERLGSDGWSVLRFNFRGVGASDGDFGLGEDEVADALGAYDVLTERASGLPIALAGWSFGAAVALRALPECDAVACAAIAPAVAPRPGITSGAPPPGPLAGRAPILVVCGANDDQVSPEDCRAWAGEAGATYEEMAGANHFFWARYEPLADVVASFLNDVRAMGRGAP